MRNLKKILAMVLALVMSLSLMATAGAADFKDQADISEKYQTAVEVLRNLEVFNGYAEDNTFRPENSITREEVAAIIYRIATGDVKGASAGIYADYNIFKDVTPDRWSAGYINFCANAEYIKGHGNGNFDPKGNVTGYEALAMILRAIGYTANGGFSGPEWHLQTGRVAEARGITKNVQMGTLGEPASRQTVAELLFQSILVNMVNYDQRTGYYELEQSLGYKVFQLEELEGVVVANEFANLNTDQVLAEGKTQIQVADETNTRTLNISSDLTDIGESRYVYTQDTSKVLAMGDTGKNTVKENAGAATDIATTSKFQSAAGMPAASDIEYYVNFDRVGTYTCDQRLEFSVTFQSQTAENSFDSYAGVNISKVAAADNKNLLNGGATNDDDWTVTEGAANVTISAYDVANEDYATNYPVTYHKIIRAGLTIKQTDMDVISGIFGAADNTDNNYFFKDAITGDVFVGTVSTNPTLREEEDLSNRISFNTFFNEYINDVTYDTSWVESYNGEWVKFIDNDGDGRCDYAFKTWSVLDEVMDSYTKDGKTVLVYQGFSDNNGKVRYLDGTPALGDKVLWSEIDNQILVEPAKNETVKVNSYSWREDQIVTDKGTYGQSGIYNNTDLQEQIHSMDENLEYIVYFDHFGYVRAFELATKPQYALITEIYGNNVSNGNLVNNNSLTIELSIPDSDTSVKKAEYLWTNPNNALRALTPWTTVSSTVGAYNYYNYLQPAISHLGVTRTDLGPVRYAPVLVNTDWTFWNRGLQRVHVINSLGWNNARTEISGEFDYGPYQYGASVDKTTPVTTSFTNIGVARVEDGKATVDGAAQLKLRQDGSVDWFDDNGNGKWDANERARYAVDYIQLGTGDIAAKSVRYGINSNSIANYVINNNRYVNAVESTEYYIVYNGGVAYFKGFSKFPGLTNKDNNIHAAYAVARDTSADNANKPYWVADVIVYEVETLDNLSLNSIALAYYTPSRTSGSIQQINTINSKYGMAQLVPGNYAWDAQNGQWGEDYAGYGFYALYNETEPVDNVMSAASIKRIQNAVRTDGNYGKNNIHAGIVTRVTELATGGAYIDVATNNAASTTTTVSLEATDQIYSVTTSQNLTDTWYGYNEANLLRWSNIGGSRVKTGDLVIWVGEYKTSDAVKSSANFVIDLGNTLPEINPNSNRALFSATPDFLVSGTRGPSAWSYNAPATTSNGHGLWQNIMDEQAAPAAPGTTTKLTIKAYDRATGNYIEDLTFDMLNGTNTTINNAQLDNIAGYSLYGIYADAPVLTGAVYEGTTLLASSGNLTVAGTAGTAASWALTYANVAAANKATYYAVFDKVTYTIGLAVGTGTVSSGLVNGAFVAAINGATVSAGDTFSFDITVPSKAANNYPAVPVTATGTADAAGTDSFTWSWANDTTLRVGGKAYNNVIVTVATPSAITPIVVNGAGSGTVSFSLDGGTSATTLNVYPGETRPVTATVTGASNVFYGVAISKVGMKTVVITADTVVDNRFTIPASFFAIPGNVTVTSLTYATSGIALTTATTGASGTLNWNGAGSAPATLNFGDTLTVSSTVPVTVTAAYTAASNFPAPVVTPVAGTNNMSWQITGFYEAITVTVADDESAVTIVNSNSATVSCTVDGVPQNIATSSNLVIPNAIGKTITLSGPSMTVAGSGSFTGNINPTTSSTNVTVTVTNGGILTIS